MENLTSAALNIIRETRSVSLPHWGNVESRLKPSETGGDVVTKLDLQIEEHLAKEFKTLDPSIGYVGEEFGGDRTMSRHWLVDPIDGTAHFVRGLPYCTTMVALIEEGKVTFSAIYDFVNDVMYHAERGRGAFKDNERIQVSERPFQGAFVYYESNLKKEGNLELFLNAKKNLHFLSTLNAGYEFAQVAMGKIEGRICVTPFGYDYDFAPGSLLIAEAGGVVTNLYSTEFDYKNLDFIATNKHVHAGLTEGPDAVFPVRT